MGGRLSRQTRAAFVRALLGDWGRRELMAQGLRPGRPRPMSVAAAFVLVIVAVQSSQDVIEEESGQESPASLATLHQLLVERHEARYHAQQVSRATRLQQHRLQQCHRAMAYAARDSRVANKFAAFAKQYEQHCLQFEYSCQQNRKYKMAMKRYRARAAGWHKRIATLKCKGVQKKKKD